MINEKVIHGNPYNKIDIKNSKNMIAIGIIIKVGIFLLYLINNKNIKLKIDDNKITNNIIIKNKYTVSSNTKNGFFSQIRKLKKKVKLKQKLYKKIFDLLFFIEGLSKI